MSKVVTEETLFTIMNSYEQRIARLEQASYWPRTAPIEFALEGNPADVRIRRSGVAELTIDKPDGVTARLVVSGGMDISGFLRLKSDTWHLDTDGYQRLYYGGNSHSYYKTRDAHVFRNSADTDLLTITSGGSGYFRENLYIAGSAVPRGGGYTNTVGRLVIYHNSGTVDWTQSTIECRADSGFANPKVVFHIPNSVAPSWKANTENVLHGVGDSDAYYVRCRAVFEGQSDETLKQGFVEARESKYLDSMRKMPVHEYQWKREPHLIQNMPKKTLLRRGVGPTAQSFHAAFPGLPGSENATTPTNGTEDLSYIPLTDAIGVCMAAIKAVDKNFLALESSSRWPAIETRINELEKAVALILIQLTGEPV